MPATRPYTPMVMINAMPASTATCVPNDAAATVPRVMTMISAERMKSVRMAPWILSFSRATRSTVGSASACGEFGVMRVVLGSAVQKLVRQFLEAFEAEKRAAQHQQRRHRPWREGADGECRRHQNRLVDERAFGHRPHHRQFALGSYPGDLLGVERKVIAQHTGGFLRRDLGHHRHVVEDGRDVVEQREQAGPGH